MPSETLIHQLKFTFASVIKVTERTINIMKMEKCTNKISKR